MSLLAIVLAVVVAQALGTLWYSPVMFSREWMMLSGVDLSKSPSTKSMWRSYTGSMLLSAVTSLMLYYLLAAGFSITDLFAIWSAFSLPIYASSVLWGGKPIKLFLIEAGYGVVSLALMVQVIIWVA